MNHEIIRIDLEKKFGEDLMQLVQGDIITDILQKAKVEERENIYQKILTGYHFKISDNLSPKLAEICEEVKESLAYEEEIDFYITNNPEINAVSIASIEENQKHIIALNSGLIERLDHEELKFVIGHEIGHLITNNAKIRNVIRFVFPDPDYIPLVIKNKIDFWDRLSELSADRFGFIASANLEKVVSSFFKLASGISTDKINFNYEEYLRHNKKILEMFKSSKGVSDASHPINPLRLEAIRLFSKSKLFSSIKSDDLETDEELNSQIQEVLGNFALLADSEIAQHRMYFIASAGFILANVDAKFDKKEYDYLIGSLARFTLFPRQLLDDIISTEAVEKVFQKSAQEILKQNPSERYPMFGFLIDLALSDNEILSTEIEFLFEIGKNLFSLNSKEIAQLIADSIHKKFIPKLY